VLETTENIFLSNKRIERKHTKRLPPEEQSQNDKKKANRGRPYSFQHISIFALEALRIWSYFKSDAFALMRICPTR